MKVCDYFFQLLRIVCGKANALSATPSVEEWMSIFVMSEQQALMGVVFSAIEKLPSQQRPPSPLILRWFAYSEKIKAKNKLIDSEVVRLQSFFASNGFRTTVLKGQGVATLYPQPLLRTPGDIDIWVEGGTDKIVSFLREHCQIGIIAYHHVEAHLSEKVEVEVHFRPTWMWNPLHNYRLQRWFKQQVACQMSHRVRLSNGDNITMPTNEFDIVFLLIHVYRHLFNEGVGLRQIMDVYYVLTHSADGIASCGSGIDKSTIVDRLRSLGLLRFAGAVMYVLRHIFMLDTKYLIVDEDIAFGEFLLREIMLAGNFGHYDKRLLRGVKVGSFNNLKRSVVRNHKFLKYCPNEIVWEIPFKVWHYLWRRIKNGGVIQPSSTL